jgi:CheY-like chemotaxis protein
MNIEAKPGRYVHITVADTGEGMPDHVVGKIFEPFFTTKHQGEGTGLGLSTALGIVKSHGGFINVYSETGKGTNFGIFIPAIELPQARQARETPDSLPLGQGELVLVVDDEAAILEIAKGTLEAYGYRAITASDGTEAVALYAEHKDDIKVVLTDLGMPHMDGLTTIRILKKMNPNIRIIATSGLRSEGKASDVAGLGVKTFLSKPYTADKLLVTLARILERD